MRPRSRKLESLPNLSESLHHQLNSYALAAGAAGVGLLALVQPAEGKIVYTAAHVKIVQNAGLITFDLNHDGIPDFGLSNKYVGTSFGFAYLKVKPVRQANQILQINSQRRIAAGALKAGTKIGPGGNFKPDPKGLVMAFADFEGTTYGPWLRVKQAYLGLKFVIKGKIHFGWARLKLTSTGRLSMNATLTGYAYETRPNKPIVAGKTQESYEIGGIGQGNGATFDQPTPRPASLGLLARGATGLVAWRRRTAARCA